MRSRPVVSFFSSFCSRFAKHSSVIPGMQITENPYLQYFIGLEKYQIEPPFDPSLMVYFRKRLDQKIMKKINKMICQSEKPREPKDKDPGDPGNSSGAGNFEVWKPTENKGKLLLDATCAPADIRYPTDLSLLNEAREKTEKTIDTGLHKSSVWRLVPIRLIR